jgi:hypothetical protein
MGRFTQRPLGVHPRLKELETSPFWAVRGVDEAPMSPGEDLLTLLVTGDDDDVDEPE